MKSAVPLLALACLAAAIGCPAAAQARPELREGLYVEGMVVVRFSAAATRADRAAFFDDLGASEIRHIEVLDYWTAVISRRTTGEAIDEWIDSPLVESIEPNGIVFADGNRPPDPEFPRQWHLENVGQETLVWGPGTPGADIGASRAWCISRGHPDVVVAVLDTGVRWDHPDLADNIFRNPGEIDGNGIDDDENGKIDDVRGWDFEGVSFSGSGDNDPMDTHGHGTLVAGVIAASADGIGAVGVAPEVTILPVRVLTLTNTSPPSGSHVEVALGIIYAVDMGADLLNCSFGSEVGSGLVGSALQYAQVRQVVAVCAAGNSGQDTDLFSFFPASFDLPNIISVAASTPDDGFAWSFSNWGKRNVDLVAPGIDIWGPLLRVSSPEVLYGSASGTSFATPQVTGTMALIEAIAPGLVHPTPREALLDHVTVKPELATLVASGGRLNVHATLAAISDLDEDPPATVDDLEVVGAGTGWIELEWTAPGDDGWDGTACCYDIRWSGAPIGDDFASATGVYLTPTPVPGGERQRFRIDGLDQETAYWFELTASDEIAGESAPSNEVSASTLAALVTVSPDSIEVSGLTGASGTFELVIGNVSGMPVDWEAGVDVPWLNVPVPAGSVPPGGTATLEVEWNANGQASGGRSGLVTIVTNDELQSVDVPVTVIATSAPDVAFLPTEIDFGTRFLGYPTTLGLAVRNVGFAPLAVADITGPQPGDGFSVSPTSFTVAPGEQVVVDVRFAPDVPGSSSVDLIVTSNDPFDPLSTVPVAGFSIRPPALDLSIDSIVAQIVTGEPAIQVPFTIRNLETAGPSLEVSLEVTDLGRGAPGWLTVQPAAAVIPAGGEVEALATLSADALEPGLFAARIGVLTNDPERPEVTVPVLFDVSGLAALEMDGSTLDFGSVPVGTFEQRVLTVSSAGNDSLFVTAEVGSPFVVSPDMLRLARGESGQIQVRYRPEQAQNDSAVLRFGTNDAVRPEVVVSVIGVGVVEPVWQGTVRLDRRIVVAAGEALTISAGTRVEVHVPLPEGRGSVSPAIEVHGRLAIEGTEQAWVVIGSESAAPWDGFVVGGEIDASFAEISGAGTAVHMLAGGTADLRCVDLLGNGAGVQHDGGNSATTRLRGVLLENRETNLRIGDVTGFRAGGAEPGVAGGNVFRTPDGFPDAFHAELLSPPGSPLELGGNAWVDGTGVVLSDANEDRILARITGPGAGSTIVLPVLVGVPSSCDARPGPVPLGPPPPGVSLATRVPNPARSGVTVDYGLPAGFAGSVVLDIHDVRGIRVRRLVEGPGAGGQFEVAWPLTDSAGRHVSTGVYFFRLSATGLGVSTRKIVVLR